MAIFFTKYPYTPSPPLLTIIACAKHTMHFHFHFHFHFFFLLSLLHLYSSTPTHLYPFHNNSYHIDCGGTNNFTDKFNVSWLSDRFFTGGLTATVSQPLLFTSPQEKTLRYFPLSSGKQNCYVFPDLVPGRYHIRTFTVYDDYDGKSHTPSFHTAVEGTLVFSWRSPWPEVAVQKGAYSDLFVFINDSDADVCFYSIATDAPVIGSISIIQVDQMSYDSNSIGDNFILVNYGRLDCGAGQWGPGFTNDTDYFGRSWQSDEDFRTSEPRYFIHTLSTRSEIMGTNQQPNYFPNKLYQTAVMANNGYLGYDLEVDAKQDYVLWLHFAELDLRVSEAGQRVFDVVVNEKNVTRVDIYKEVGILKAYDWHYVVKNLSTNMLSVRLVPAVGKPLLCGLENYALVPVDLSTDPQQVIAMKALKESLKVPDRMGWNGDPCAPSSWDAWEGVTCHKNGSSLIISHLELGSRDLKGIISNKIGLLTNLVSLNLSSNSLGGTIPPGLGQKSLARLDLSHNQLTGSIPSSLTSSNLQLVLLNDNLLEGPVPEALYSIGVHGGSVDLSENKKLCGAPPLKSCSLFDGGLSPGAKVGIALSCLLFVTLVLLLLYFCCIRKGTYDYDFALPQELTALAAKRNRYERQKSLMVLEMESQHAKALPSLFTAHSRSAQRK